MDRFWSRCHYQDTATERCTIETPVLKVGGTPPVPVAYKISFTDGTEFGVEDVRCMLHRECYSELIELLRVRLDGRAVHAPLCASVFGSSGVGKSLLVYRLVLHFVKHHASNGLTRPTFVIKLPTKIYHLHYMAAVGGVAGAPTVTENPVTFAHPDYYFSDTDPCYDSHSANILQLHVSFIGNKSEDYVFYNEWFGDRDPLNRLSFIVPPFSFEEYEFCFGLRDAAGHLLPNQYDLQYKFDILGGCVQHLVGKIGTNHLPRINAQIYVKQINEFFDGVTYNFPSNRDDITENCAMIICELVRRTETNRPYPYLYASTLHHSFILSYSETVYGEVYPVEYPASKVMSYILGDYVERMGLNAGNGANADGGAACGGATESVKTTRDKKKSTTKKKKVVKASSKKIK